MQLAHGITQVRTTTLPALSSANRLWEVPAQSLAVKSVAVCAKVFRVEVRANAHAKNFQVFMPEYITSLGNMRKWIYFLTFMGLQGAVLPVSAFPELVL